MGMSTDELSRKTQEHLGLAGPFPMLPMLITMISPPGAQNGLRPPVRHQRAYARPASYASSMQKKQAFGRYYEL
jgi:hypothetical protein